jgi:hypothetical protein
MALRLNIPQELRGYVVDSVWESSDMAVARSGDAGGREIPAADFADAHATREAAAPGTGQMAAAFCATDPVLRRSVHRVLLRRKDDGHLGGFGFRIEHLAAEAGRGTGPQGLRLGAEGPTHQFLALVVLHDGEQGRH